MAGNKSIQDLKVETYNHLTKLRGWQLAIFTHELDQTQARIIQAGGVIPDAAHDGTALKIEKRELLSEIVDWVPALDTNMIEAEA
ncbi:MAG: hypothetical protein AAGD96_01500 [Chloroflexota bacterium]